MATHNFATTFASALALAQHQGSHLAYAMLRQHTSTIGRFAYAAYIQYNPSSWCEPYDVAPLRDHVSLPVWHNHHAALTRAYFLAAATAFFQLVDS